MFLSQQAGQGGREREVRHGKFLCDDWTAFGLDQLEWHGLREGRHSVESLTSAVCAFTLVLSYALHTQTPTAGDQAFIRAGMCMLRVSNC